MTLVQLAGALPRNPRFREWATTQDGPWFDGPEMSDDSAARFIRVVCCVTSRRDLATNPEAAQRFENLIRKPFVEWCEQQQQPA